MKRASTKDIEKLLGQNFASKTKEIFEGSYMKVHIIECDDVSDLSKKGEAIGLIADACKDAPFIYVAGLHASGKYELTRKIIEHTGGERSFHHYDYASQRDDLRRDGWVSDKSMYAQVLESFETAHMVAGRYMALAGGSFIVSDPGLTKARRLKFLRYVGNNFETTFNTCIMCFRDLDKMIEYNDKAQRQITTYRMLEEYVAESMIDFPTFEEGFRNIVFVNMRDENGEATMSNSAVENFYDARYEDIYQFELSDCSN